MTKDRSGRVVAEADGQDRFLRFCYRSVPGRLVLRLARARWCSLAVGAFMNSRLSKGRVKRVIRQTKPELSQFENTQFRSFNEYFTRKRKAGIFPVCADGDRFCSPADSRLTVVPLREGKAFPVKQAPYTVSELLEDAQEAKRYENGYALVFRLCVDDYHRYSYPDDGREVFHKYIPGTLHTVNPIALAELPVFHRNSREVTWIDSDHFGRIAMVEVGAMLVGRIVNTHRERFARGEEKGYFEFGGSTVVVLVSAEQFRPDADLLENSEQGIETYVRSGEAVGSVWKA